MALLDDCKYGLSVYGSEIQLTLMKAGRYPDDRATGYKPGDLRGAVSVRVRFD